MTAPGRIRLDSIPSAFEGMIPAPIATVAADGTPNITYLSVVHRIDEEHVALSRQFFKKTDENTTVNPFAQVTVTEVSTGRQFRLDLRYERTDTRGPLFERMRTALDAVAAYEGMAGIFALKGVDICRVLDVQLVPGDYGVGPPQRTVTMERLQEVSSRVIAAEDVDELLHTTLDACTLVLGFQHSFVMLVDETGEQLYTVASTGYGASGAGSEVRIGEGVVGLAAERRLSIRVTNLARERSYTHAARRAAVRSGLIRKGERVIPLPSLPDAQSLMVVPMLGHRKLVGVLGFHSDRAGAFQQEDECAAGILANQVAMACVAMVDDRPEPAPEPPITATAPAGSIEVKHYAEDDSVFLDNEYLIKGVAGAILWKLVTAYQESGRSEFSNKEMRLDPSLDLPDIKDNLEARLILLRKRLEERSVTIRIDKVARGRFRLTVTSALKLVNVAGAGPL